MTPIPSKSPSPKKDTLIGKQNVTDVTDIFNNNMSNTKLYQNLEKQSKSPK